MKSIFKFFIVLIFIIPTSPVKAQVEINEHILNRAIETLTDKSKDAKIKAKKVKGKINGPGICLFKNGNIYIGDLSDQKFHGFGMYINLSDFQNEKMEKAKVYVGRYKEGVKNGSSTVYNEDGDAIYNGQFLNGLPSTDLSDTLLSSRYFGSIETSDFYYIGEMESGVPDGFGAIFFNNGDFAISRFKMGTQRGITTIIYNDGNWSTEKIEDDKHVPISSSFEYDKFISERKDAIKKSLMVMNETNQKRQNETWGNFTNALKYFGNFLIAIGEGVADSQSSTYINDRTNNGIMISDASYSPEDLSSRHISTASESPKYNLSEQRAYNADKSTYNKYDSMLSQVFAGNRNASASEIKSWQLKMKNLRNKWETKGKSFPHSTNENKK